MVSLVQYGNYSVINTSDATIDGYYVINLISKTYTLQNSTTIDGNIITAGELVVKA